jgi:transcription elongation factor GreA
MVVTVEMLASGRSMTFLLGSREEAAHATVDVISPSSPLGAAVDGARVGDEVTYTTPAGKDLTARITHVEPYAG